CPEVLTNARSAEPFGVGRHRAAGGGGWQRFAPVATCGAVASVVATLATEGTAQTIWIVRDLGTVMAAFVLAAAELRIVDAIVLRRQAGPRSAHAEAVGCETQRLLGAGQPGVSARAAELDAASLIDRVLQARRAPGARD